MSLEDLLIWIVFLHNTNKREAVATAISEIRSDFGGCSKEQVKAVGETLGRLFTSNELNWLRVPAWRGRAGFVSPAAAAL